MHFEMTPVSIFSTGISTCNSKQEWMCEGVIDYRLYNMQ